MCEPEGKVEKATTSVHPIAALEALLFAAGDPLSLQSLAQMLQMPEEECASLLQTLQRDWASNPQKGIYLREVEGKYTLATKPICGPVLEALFAPEVQSGLTPAAYEALAIVAYNQPVTRAQVEVVRGVNSDGVMQRLLERDLIEVKGFLEAPGRPALFGTTDQFLEAFGLNSVEALPPMELLMYSSLQELEKNLQEAASGQAVRDQLQLDRFLRESGEPSFAWSAREKGAAEDVRTTFESGD